MIPKHPLEESKRTLFLKNRYILTPNHDSVKSRSASKNNLFFAFLWSRMCTTLLFECPPCGLVLVGVWTAVGIKMVNYFFSDQNNKNTSFVFRV